MTNTETQGEPESNLSQFWFVPPCQSEALDNAIQSIRGQPTKAVCNCSGKACGDASGVGTGWIQGEEFLCESCHLLKDLYSVTGVQLHLISQRLHKQRGDLLALESERWVCWVSQTAEVFCCVHGIFGFLGYSRALGK